MGTGRSGIDTVGSDDQRRGSAMTAAAGSRWARFTASLVTVVGLVTVVPWALVAVARYRFGGASPLHGITVPDGWDPGSWWRTANRPAGDALVGEIVVRASLVVVWFALVALVVTVVAEVVHVVRHDGLGLPDVRGLGPTQRMARLIATGLLVVLPVVGSSTRTLASGSVPAVLESIGAGPVVVRSSPGPVVVGRVVAGPDDAGPVEPGRYVVRPGDSVYGIAERLVGPDGAAVERFAGQLLDLNLGRVMVDGQRFTNAALIDVGWVLDLPPVGDGDDDRVGGVHVVEPGDTLWTIADDRLGDGSRWTELFDENRGRTFADGATLDDPDLILPGWDLAVPTEGPTPPTTPTPPRPDPVSTDPQPPATVLTPTPPATVPAVPGTTTPVTTPAVPVATMPATTTPLTTTPATVPVTATPVSTDPPVAPPPAPSAPDGPRNGWLDEPSADEQSVELLSVGRAAMLSAGVLAVLAVRRRERLRRSDAATRLAVPPEALISLERSLRVNAPVDPLVRLDVAVRSAAPDLVAGGVRLVSVLAVDDGRLTLRASGPATLGHPWQATDDPAVWDLPARVRVEDLAARARQGGAPCPALVQLGRTVDGADLYVDLEAFGSLAVEGPVPESAAVVTALAASLASSALAEVATLVGVGVDPAVFFAHRRHLGASTLREAIDVAVAAAGTVVVADRSTFELRTLGTGGESWEPAVVFAAEAPEPTVVPPLVPGVVIVTAGPVVGPGARLVPDDDAWTLHPLGVRCVPVGLDRATARGLGALVASPDDHDVTMVPTRADDVQWSDPASDRAIRGPFLRPCDVATDVPVDPPAFVVHVLGPVGVRSVDGEVVTFERSKANELVVWLATHRERSTRTSARTALWDLGVRDATFANVVSDARRSLARALPPPDGEEWIGRTLTDQLPLHPAVRTDAELLRKALDLSRTLPPREAIEVLRPAMRFVVGMPFEGTDYLWPDAEGLASQLVLLATVASSELATHCLAVGDAEGVFDATGRGLQVLPGHEELVGLRMRAHAAAGDRAGVRREWERYERVIHADPWSDGEPSVRLADLRRELTVH